MVSSKGIRQAPHGIDRSVSGNRPLLVRNALGRSIAAGIFRVEHRLIDRRKGEITVAKDDPEICPLRGSGLRARLVQSRDPSMSGTEPLDDSVDNWITAGWWLNKTGTPVTYFRSQWKVPKPPSTDRGQLVFLFNGREPRLDSVRTILQPVLTWGRYGSRWTVLSYLYPTIGTNPGQTEPVEVCPGDVLTGVIRLIGQGASGFSYRCEFEGICGTALTVHDIPQLVYCVVTLEADEAGCGNTPYELKAPSDYPNARRTRFRRIRVETGTSVARLNWRPCNYLEKLPTYYGAHTKVVSRSATNGRVDIYYARRGCLSW